MRFSKAINAVKDSLDRGEMGSIQTAIACCRRFREQPYYSGWRGTWALDGGGACMNQGIHLIDTLLYLLGEPAEVFAHTGALAHDIEVEDTATATIRFRSGTLAALQCTTCAYPDFGTRLELHGMQGSVGLGARGLAFWNKASDPAFKPNPDDYREGEPGEEFPLHARVYEDVVTALRENRPLRVDGREGRRAVALIEAIYHSGRTGQPVAVGG
jgi:predicted dehydrogenase